MYGLGSGSVASAAAGAVSTIAGVTALPNTGGNVALMVLSVATIVAGVAIVSSFTVTRIASKLYR